MNQLLIIDIADKILSEDDVVLLAHPLVAGVLLFTRNFENQEQLQALTSAIHAIRPDILIAVDHEGGYVQRFQRHGFSPLPAAEVFGKVYDVDPNVAKTLARHYGLTMAQELLACGVDVSLAPVLDVDGGNKVISGLGRAFHHAPKVVGILTSAYIDGMNEAGMPATGKHYPGHGSVLGDSHLTMPVCNKTWDALEEQDLRPFIDLIHAKKLAAIMPAHVVYQAIDPNNPAGFSKICLDGLRAYGFDGLIMSDCLGMKGSDVGTLFTRATRALEAGCDVLIVCNQTRAHLKSLMDDLIRHQVLSDERAVVQQRRFQDFLRALKPKIKQHFKSSVYTPVLDDVKSSNEFEQFNHTRGV